MGLGKTATAIRALDEIEAKSVLVLCPAVACVNWSREFDRFSSYQRDTEIVSYGSLHKIDPEKRWDALILDESHYLKSTDSKRSKLVLGSAGLVHRAKVIWALSGTPAPNNASELWPIMYTFGATPLLYGDFVEKYCTHRLVSGKHFQITGTKVHMIPELRALLKPILLRETAQSVGLELPPITHETVVVKSGKVGIPTENESILNRLERERDLLKQFLSTRNEDLSTIGDSISTLRRISGLRKISPVVEMVKGELESNAYRKIAIFAHHREVIEEVCKGLSSFGSVHVYGGTKTHERQSAIDSFQKDPSTRVFGGSIQAAGTAITLTEATQVLFIEYDWVPGNNAQVIKRASRIGSRHPLHVRFVSLNDPLDERVTRTLERKTAELSGLFTVDRK